MYEVKDKVTYYFVNREEGKTFEIGNFDDMIIFLAKKLSFSLVNGRETAFEHWDFSGGDIGHFTKFEKEWGLTRVWVAAENKYDWRYAYHAVIKHYRAPKPYMVVDSEGRVIDSRIHVDKIKRVKPVSYDFKRRNDFVYGEKLVRYRYHKDSQNDFFFYRCSPVPYVHHYKSWGRGTHKGIHNTIRNNEYCRPKARVPVDYWDNFPHIDRSWKRNHKCRYQWMKHISKGGDHYET